MLAKLEENKINYLLIDRRNNYDVDEKSDNKNLNKYDIFFEKAKKYIILKNRIDNIYEYLISNMENEKELIKQIEKFKILNYIRELIVNIDKNMDNFPKKDIELKNRIRNANFNVRNVNSGNVNANNLYNSNDNPNSNSYALRPHSFYTLWLYNYKLYKR